MDFGAVPIPEDGQKPPKGPIDAHNPWGFAARNY